MSVRARISQTTQRLPQVVVARPVVIFTVALALRMAGIGILPLTDQQITVEMVQRFGPVEMLWSIPRVQPHFPLYYVFLDLWASVFPITAAELVSMVAGAAVPAVAYCWFRSIVEDYQTARAGVLLVIAPPLVVQSRWLRMYALLALFVLLSWWAAWRWLHEDGRLVTYGVLSIAVVGLHPFGVAVVVAQIVWLSVEQYYGEWRVWFRPTVAAIGVVGAIGVIWLFARVAGVRGTGTISPENMHIQYADSPIQRALTLPLTTITGTAIGTGILVLVLASTVVLVWWAIQARPWRTRRGRLWLCWILGTLAILYVGQAIRPVLILKYVTWLAPGVALAVVDVLPENWMGDDMMYLLSGVAVVNLIQAALLKLSVAMVSIWESGVVESGAL